MAKKIDIAGTLNAATTDGVLGFSEQIKDESKGKMQSSLNKEFGEGIERIERKSDIAYNAVKTLEGLSNANEAMQTLAGQVVQIEENKQNIASNKADADAKLTELGLKVRNPIGLPTTKGIMELILMVVDDGVDHVLGIRQIVSATGRLGIADLTSGKNYYISNGEDGFTGGVREYWYKHSYSGYYILLYVKVDWNEVVDVPYSSTDPANTITVRAKQSFSIDGANLVDMLMSCNYDIVGDVVYNSDDIIQSARIKWRDGTSGNIVKSNYNSDVLEYNSTTISYNDYIKVVKELEYDDLGNIVKESTNINIK